MLISITNEDICILFIFHHVFIRKRLLVFLLIVINCSAYFFYLTHPVESILPPHILSSVLVFDYGCIQFNRCKAFAV